jgi:formiminotetrahydrofolate cyclodeaminase
MIEKSCVEFTGLLASKAPVPGGGGASALVGAVGVALGNMVGNLTLGKKKYAEVEAEIVKLNGEAGRLRGELLALVGKDAEAFEPLSRAYGLPKDAEHRDEIMEEALVKASAVPIEIMRKLCEAIELVEAYAEKGSSIAVSDAGCAAVICKAALKAAALNVFINTKLMKDREAAGKLNTEADMKLREYGSLADEIYEQVTGRIRG